MLVLAGRPVSIVLMHVWFNGIRGHFGETAGKSMVRLLFLLLCFFSVLSEFKKTVLVFYPMAFVDW